ncbi:MAG: sulfotransferase domain-containing protein [Geobacteraceae bacterium]|nr:sulfotransferase domain-containing protein [Geobacteraceae bacterium]
MEDTTIFHITHWKAGSQWIKRILKEAAPRRYIDSKIAPRKYVDSKINIAHFLNDPIRQGYIYPTVYVTKEQFESVSLPSKWSRFIVIRDLRDTLVSGYFSMKISHPILTDYNKELRTNLNSMSFDDGMIFLAEGWLKGSAAIQKSWVDLGEEIIRYEDLLQNDTEILTKTLIDKCGLNISKDKLFKIIMASRFEVLTGGRKKGDEDIYSHERKGICGDWKNYFSEKISERFKLLYGDLLIATGYEKDMIW